MQHSAPCVFPPAVTNDEQGPASQSLIYLSSSLSVTTMSADVKRSDYNPFRAPTLTPNPTGLSSSTPAAASSPIQQPRSPSPPPLPQRSSSSQLDEPRRQDTIDVLAASLGSANLEDGAPAEPPPAYSLTANPTQGESVVEYGPRRPFQPAPPSQPQVFHSNTGMSQQQYFTGPPGAPYASPQQTGMPVALLLES